MNKISVASLIQFDHAMLLERIVDYLDVVDEVVLGLATDRVTWFGNQFEVPDSFFAALKSIDKDNKIRIVEEQFFQEGVAAPIDNLTRARNILSSAASVDSWLISIDPDETIVNLKEFVEFLRTFDAKNVAIFGKQTTILKHDGEKIFVVENQDWAKDDVCLATKKRNGYTVNRYTDEPIAFAPVYVLNNSWGRSDEAVTLKLQQNIHMVHQKFDQFLRELNASNYKQFENFHPFGGSSWEHITLVEGSIASYIDAKLDALREQQAWIATSLYARTNLFESKVAGRDANIADLKASHKSEMAQMRSEYEAKLLAHVRNYKELKMQLDAELLANKARQQR